MRQHGLTTCVGTAILLLQALLHAGSGVGSVSYRGPSRNGVFPETGLMREWPDRGPELVWRFGNLGPSWASVAVGNDAVYVPGGGSVGKLFTFTLDGRLKWAKKYGPEFSVRYQGARGTPILGQIDGPKLALARVTEDGFEIVSSFQPQWGDRDMWIHPVIADGRLYYRSDCAQGGDRLKAGGKLAVYDLRADQLPALRQRRRETERLVQQLDAKSPADRADAADQLAAMVIRPASLCPPSQRPSMTKTRRFAGRPPQHWRPSGPRRFRLSSRPCKTIVCGETATRPRP